MIAASGPYIHAFNAVDGKYLSSWPSIQETKASNQVELDRKLSGNESAAPSSSCDITERPQKRRKLSSAREDSGSSAEIVIENGDVNLDSLRAKQSSDPVSPVILLVCDSTGGYIVAVTGDDKAIRVFELTADGLLSQKSER